MAAILRASVRRTMVGLMPLAQRLLIEILERSGLHTRPGSGSFEQTFQIMVVVLVQSSNGKHLLRAPYLTFDQAIFRTDVGL